MLYQERCIHAKRVFLLCEEISPPSLPSPFIFSSEISIPFSVRGGVKMNMNVVIFFQGDARTDQKAEYWKILRQEFHTSSMAESLLKEFVVYLDLGSYFGGVNHVLFS
jgi:hypothetical protein